MARDTARRASVLSHVRRFAFAVAVSLLVAATSGIPFALAMSLEHGTVCGDACKRCWCKQHSEQVHVRAPCPCCSRGPTTSGVIASGDPAVVQRALLLLPPSQVTETVSPYAPSEPSFAPPVPHPPPRHSFSTSA